jgi:OFA family oxalate/formate antiporter-like MFS transporter
MNSSKSLGIRWLILAVGVVTMLFAGIIYAWSIIKSPFAGLGFEAEDLAFNFTLTMSFFCIGGLLSTKLVKLLGVGLTIILSGVLAGAGFILSSLLGEGQTVLLYFTYALMSGLGIGIVYITIISSVNAWFPDRKGLSSGALMMGFGASSLVLGNLADSLFKSDFGWRNTYILLGILLAAVLCLSAIFIKRPDSSVTLPEPKKLKGKGAEDFEIKDMKPSEMIRRFTFWRAFVFLICITAVGSSVISFSKDFILSFDAEKAALATTMVGVFAICNGLGRIITGAVFDALGRRFTMLAASLLSVVAAGITLLSAVIGSLPLAIVGICLIGMSYGTSPTVASAFTASFYGNKHFASNLGVMNFNLMCASFTATLCANILKATGGFVAPFILLVSLAAVSFALNFTIRKP